MNSHYITALDYTLRALSTIFGGVLWVAVEFLRFAREFALASPMAIATIVAAVVAASLPIRWQRWRLKYDTYSQAISQLSAQWGAVLANAFANPAVFRVYHFTVAAFVAEILEMTPRWWSIRDLRMWFRYRHLRGLARDYLDATAELGIEGPLPQEPANRTTRLFLRALLEWGRIELRL